MSPPILRPVRAADDAAVASINSRSARGADRERECSWSTDGSGPRSEPVIIRTVMPAFGADGPGFAIHDPEVSAMSAAYDRAGAAYFVIVDRSAHRGDRARECSESTDGSGPRSEPISLIEHDGRVVGGGGVAPLDGGDPGTCEIRKMYFLEEARGLGLGKKLLAHCLETTRALGYRRAYLETLTGMDQAQALYTKMGFTRIDGPCGSTGHGGCDRFYDRAL